MGLPPYSSVFVRDKRRLGPLSGLILLVFCFYSMDCVGPTPLFLFYRRRTQTLADVLTTFFHGTTPVKY